MYYLYQSSKIPHFLSHYVLFRRMVDGVEVAVLSEECVAAAREFLWLLDEPIEELSEDVLREFVSSCRLATMMPNLLDI